MLRSEIGFSNLGDFRTPVDVLNHLFGLSKRNRGQVASIGPPCPPATN